MSTPSDATSPDSRAPGHADASRVDAHNIPLFAGPAAEQRLDAQNIPLFGRSVRPLSVVALLAGEPTPEALYTLHRLSELPVSLHVVQAEGARAVPARKRLKRLVREHGVVGVASRLLAGRTLGRSEGARRERELDLLFDGDALRAWWAGRETAPARVPGLNHPDGCAAVAACEPDLIVRVTGGILKPELFSLARVATLNIHHGMAPAIRGMWSIPWGIVEGRRDWIGATVHVVDAGIDTGRVLWRGSPQLAAGDTGTTLFFRAHVQAVDALSRIVARAGEALEPLGEWEAPAESAYRSAPGIGAWARYVALGRGRRARVLLESAAG